MQKYVLVKFLEQVEDGAEFPSSQWPLHVTLVPNFAVDRHAIDLSDKLAEITKVQEHIVTVAGDDEHFGPQRQTQVTILRMTPQLSELHKKLVSLLKDKHAIFDEPQYMEDGYRAHVTVQKNGRVHAGDPVTIDELTLVDMFPGNDLYRRKALKTFKFGG